MKLNQLRSNLEKVIIIILNSHGRHYGQTSYLKYYFILFLYKIYVKLKVNRTNHFQQLEEDKNNKKINDLNHRGIKHFDPIELTKVEEISEYFYKIDKNILRPKPSNNPSRFTVPAENLGIPQILQIGLRDDVISSIEAYFGCLPTLQYITMWETLCDDNKLPEMYFHSDNHAFRFIKVFVLLTDVNEGGGHHEFVQKTHKASSFKSLLGSIKNNDEGKYKNLMIALENKRKEKEKLSKNIINESFKNNLLKVYGNKGSIFAEDTGGLHRGTKIVKNEPRLLLQYLFTPYDNKRKNDKLKKFLPRSLLHSSIDVNCSRSIKEYEYITRLFLLD